MNFLQQNIIIHNFLTCYLWNIIDLLNVNNQVIYKKVINLQIELETITNLLTAIYFM